MTALTTTELTSLDVLPAHEAESVVEKQMARRGAVGNEQGCFGSGGSIEGVEVGIGEDVDIVDEDGRCGVEEVTCVFYATARLEQAVAFVADKDIEAEAVVSIEEVDDLLTEMMDVDDDAFEAKCLQTLDDVLQQGLTSHRHEGFGHRVGEGAEACAEAGSENHCLFHGAKIRRIYDLTIYY